MGDNEQNTDNPGNNQEEDEGTDEQPRVAVRRPVEESQGLSGAAPADDEIIIK
jgi:hypothetical protein